jgi:hypothetical protein
VNVIVHYPTDPVKLQELNKKIAVAHSNAISKYIEHLACPLEQKKEIISRIILEK